MKQLTSVFAIILSLSVILSGCKKDSKEETKNNYLKVDTTEYELSHGYLTYSGNSNSTYYINLDLCSPEITLPENIGPWIITGYGQRVSFLIYSANANKLTSGQYPRKQTGQVGTFRLASYWDIEPDSMPHNWIISGNLEVANFGSEYELSFSGKDEDSKPISFYYKGSLEYRDFSGR